MALIFTDGFDKYGPASSVAANVATAMAGEWTTFSGVTIVAPLSATGQAVNASTLSKTLPASYSRIIGGVRFSASLSASAGVQFNDAGTAQCGIGIATTGTISLRNGVYNTGTILGSGATPISANTTHYLEWDITIATSGAYNVYLDGVSIISGTGNTKTTANSSINGFSLNGATANFDDLYLFDTTGSICNAVLLTSPRIETQLPNADSAVQFSFGAAVLGATIARTTTNFGTSNNQLYVRPFTPSHSGTLNSLTITPNNTSATVNMRPVAYADSAGVPGTLLTSGSTVTGTTASTPVTLPLTTPQSLTAGTQYWLGYMVDITGLSFNQLDSSTNQGRTATSTFTSGAPGTCPSTTSGQATVLIWGNLTGTGVNYYSTNQPPPYPGTSYVFDTTVGQEDFYNFPNLTTPGSTVNAVAVKGFISKSDSGAKTVSLRVKSSSTDSGGSLTGQAPGTTYAWLGSYFPTDPNTSAAWTVANLNVAASGVRVDS